MNCSETWEVIAGLLLGRWDGRNLPACPRGLSVLEHRGRRGRPEGHRVSQERKPTERQD